ncbi:terpene synthase family protein [Amycolatopsis minnesotensis]|uniref:Terpene synthase n=1 Tax=Amycolatopsis minnesotensis TaxID=337894 RepID=A0ABN2SXR4_9PSEU
MTGAATEPGADLRLAPPPWHPLRGLDSAISPHVAELEAHIIGWADRYALLDDARARDKLARTRLGELVARTYPTILPARLEAVSGWFTWAFVIDDCFDRCAGQYDETAARTLRVLAGDREPGAAETRLEAQLADVWHRLTAGMGLTWRTRFTQHMAHFLAAFKYEAFNRRTRRVPDLLGYRQLRRASGGITPSLDLIEVASGLEVPALLHEFEQTRAMFDRAADVVVWVNDIVSLRKELAAGETTNGVLVLAAEREIGLPEAVDAAYTLVAEQVKQFEDAEAELEALLSRWRGLEPEAVVAARKFTDGMRAWMRGNLDWSFRSDRYQVTDGVLLSTDTSLLAPKPSGPER